MMDNFFRHGYTPMPPSPPKSWQIYLASKHYERLEKQINDARDACQQDETVVLVCLVRRTLKMNAENA